MMDRYRAEVVLEAFDINTRTPALSVVPSPGFLFCPEGGVVVSIARHADIAKLAARLASLGFSRPSALFAMKLERERGRWSRNVNDGELENAVDSALQKYASGEWKEVDPAVDARLGCPTLAEALALEIKPFTEEDFAEASVAHPHVFTNGNAGMFPVSEVTVVAAPGREGKTYAMVYLAAASALGRTVVGLKSEPTRALIYSSEDDKKQYARKLLAINSRLPPEDVARLVHGLIVPDLEVPGVVDYRAIVAISEKRRPVPTVMVDALIEALRPLVVGIDRFGLLIFETASTLNDADEDNPGLKTLIAAMKRIARELCVAVVLVHHTSQAAAANLPSLNVSVADIRGGTALAFNARQCFLLVNLGSNETPFPAKDMRTHLRKFVAPLSPGRFSALICLDSSKSLDPPPVFLGWTPTDSGPAMTEISPPDEIAGASWRRTREIVIAHVWAQRDEAKTEKVSADSAAAVAMAVQLHEAGKYPTVRAVSIALGHGADWASSRLEGAVASCKLIRTQESVPKTKGKTDVYRPAGNFLDPDISG